MAIRSSMRVAEIFDLYSIGLSEGRVDDVVALFSDAAEVRDPIDAPPLVGRAAIEQFFREGVDMIDNLTVTGPVRVSADGASGAAAMLAEVTVNGASLEMDTIDVITCDDAGMIVSLHAYYGPTNVRPTVQPAEEV